MNDDEKYFEIDDELRREYFHLMSLRLHQLSIFSDREQPTEEQMRRLAEIEMILIPQGPHEPEDGQIFGHQILIEVEKVLGLEWYEELTHIVTPWSKWANKENQPIYFAYWTTKTEKKHMSLWDAPAVLRTLFEKRKIYLEVVTLLSEQDALFQTINEFNSMTFGIKEKSCQFCGLIFHPSNNFHEAENIGFYLQRNSCSKSCSEILQWQNAVKKCMHKDAAFDKSLTWNAIWERFGPYCYICGIEAIHNQSELGLRQGSKAWKERWGDLKRGDTDRTAVVEHVYPRSKGGSHTWDNVRISCAKCNLLKGDSIPPQFNIESD